MSQRRHPREMLAAFLDREFRQVWAVDRITGDRVFLPVGQAAAMRERAKTSLRCPVPGCEAAMSTRGGSRRDHFFHVTPGTGHGDHESEWHLQAKAMLAAWAADADHEANVREEWTVKSADRSVHRRPDVMASWPDGRRVAFEVEYKAFTPDAWNRKQDDLDAEAITTVWLFGHSSTYLSMWRRPDHLPEAEVWDRVKWRELTVAAARRGFPVLFVDPVEQTVGTLIQHTHPLPGGFDDEVPWWQDASWFMPRLAQPREYWRDEQPHLEIDPLDECTLDIDRGLITPAMRRVEAAAEQFRQAADAAKRAHAARQQRRAERERADEAARERRTAFLRAKREEQQRAWDASELRSRVLRKFGEIPNYLAQLPTDHNGVYAHPIHWHAQLFQDLVLPVQRNSQVGRQRSVGDVYRLIAQHFPLHPQHARQRAVAVCGFLARLREEGFLDYPVEPNGRIGVITVISDDLSKARPRRPQVATAPRGSMVPRAAATSPTKQAPTKQSAAGPAKKSSALDWIVLNRCPGCGQQRGSRGHRVACEGSGPSR